MNTPKIRFKGFTDAWEQRKFGDYNDLMTGYPFESDKFSEDGIKLVRGMNVKRGYLDFSGDICVKWNSCVGLENFLLKDGDILIQMDGALIGKSYAKIKENQLPALLVQRVTRARTNNKFASQDFMYQTIQRDFLRYIEMNKTETAVPHLSLNDIRNFEIMVPCLAEQKKIGEYFDSLDNLITLHQRKCDETKQLKKFMLQKMFPKNGEKNPEIRFEGFTDDWEQRKLESLCDVFMDGDWIEAKDQSNAGIRLVQTGNVGTTKYLNKENNQKWISEETFERLHCKEIYSGDILISRLPEPAGRACIVPELGTRMITAVDCTIVRTAKEYDSKYLVQYLSTTMYFKIVNSFLGGGTRQRISRGNLSGIDIPVPGSLDEQKKIGEYFSKLDHLITLHQRKCEKLKELKKFMLQNMFV